MEELYKKLVAAMVWTVAMLVTGMEAEVQIVWHSYGEIISGNKQINIVNEPTETQTTVNIQVE